jgi:hypothetical protein
MPKRCGASTTLDATAVERRRHLSTVRRQPRVEAPRRGSLAIDCRLPDDEIASRGLIRRHPLTVVDCQATGPPASVWRHPDARARQMAHAELAGWSCGASLVIMVAVTGVTGVSGVGTGGRGTSAGAAAMAAGASRTTRPRIGGPDWPESRVQERVLIPAPVQAPVQARARARAPQRAPAPARAGDQARAPQRAPAPARAPGSR